MTENNIVQITQDKITLENTPALLTNIVLDWLESLTSKYRVNSYAEAQEHCYTELNRLGYYAPLDIEQSTISMILANEKAGEMACTAIWAFYEDYCQIRKAA